MIFLLIKIKKMFPIKKDKLSFEIKILESFSKKKIKSNNINKNSKKDLFIRKQDIYLINLLEKRIRLTKLLKSVKPDFDPIKLSNPLLYKVNQNNNNKSTQSYLENNKNLFFNYRSISLINNKKKRENILYLNSEKEKNITMKNFDYLITSKIYNKDDSKNNKNILKIITGEKNFYDTKYKNIKLTNSLLNKTKNIDLDFFNDKLKLPKINYRNIDKNKDELKKFKTIIIKRKNKYQTERNKSFTERHMEKDNKENDNNKDNYIYNEHNNNIKSVFHAGSISPIRSIKNH